MGIFDSLGKMVQPIDDEYEDEYEEEVVQRPAKSSPYESSKNNKLSGLTSNKQSEMALFEPRSFEEARAIGAKVVENSSVVVNLHRLPREYMQRTIDFLTGVSFALHGDIQKVGPNTIMVTPPTVDVTGTITLQTDDN